jgi:hypothetical protein
MEGSDLLDSLGVVTLSHAEVEKGLFAKVLNF